MLRMPLRPCTDSSVAEVAARAWSQHVDGSLVLANSTTEQ